MLTLRCALTFLKTQKTLPTLLKPPTHATHVSLKTNLIQTSPYHRNIHPLLINHTSQIIHQRPRNFPTLYSPTNNVCFTHQKGALYELKKYALSIVKVTFTFRL